MASHFDKSNSSDLEPNDFYLLSKYLKYDTFSSNGSEGDGFMFFEAEKSYWSLLLLPLPLVAVLGNILIILSVYREKSLQTQTNHLIVSLAVADLLVGAYVMPFALYTEVNGLWELGSILCDFHIAIDFTCSTASIFNLAAISVDRYIAVTYPMKYARHKDKKRVSFMIAVVWILSVLIGFPIIFIYNSPADRVLAFCGFTNADYILYSSIGSFYIPGFIMVFLYYRIFKALHERTKKTVLREMDSQFGGPNSPENPNLTKDPPTIAPMRQDGVNQVTGNTSRQIWKDGFTRNTGSVSQDNEYDEDGDDSVKFSLKEKAVEESSAIKIDIPIDGNTDSGYGTSHVETIYQQSTNLTNGTPKTTSKCQKGKNQMTGFEASEDDIVTNTGSESQDTDEDTIGDKNFRCDGNTDSGYGTSHVGHQTQVTLATEHDSPKHGQSKKFKQSKNKDIARRNQGSSISGKTKRKSIVYVGVKDKSYWQKKEKASVKREKKATKTLAIVLGMFLLCWAPFATCCILSGLGMKYKLEAIRPNRIMFGVFTWLGYFNSCVNPVIYTIFNLEFRKAFKKLLGDCW